MERKFRITRLYSGPDGKSRFEDVEVPLKDKGDIGWWSRLRRATGITFRETGGDYYFDWHTAPRLQFVITLEGEVEIEAGDGTTRRFGPGDILLAEDTTGRGHISRAVNNQPHKMAFVNLD